MPDQIMYHTLSEGKRNNNAEQKYKMKYKEMSIIVRDSRSILNVPQAKHTCCLYVRSKYHYTNITYASYPQQQAPYLVHEMVQYSAHNITVIESQNYRNSLKAKLSYPTN